MTLDLFFHPRGVALVGASGKEGKPGYVFMRNLTQDFPGVVYPVNPKETEVLGYRAYASVADVPDPVDLAVIVVPAQEVPAVVDACGRRGISAALVISGGFAEAGADGGRLQDELVAAARRHGVRVVGPNCFGIHNCNQGLNATMALGAAPKGGRISLMTQSGAYGMAIFQFAMEEQMRFAKVVAHGNKCDVDDDELLRYLGADPDTRVICAYLEAIPRGRAFFDVARAVTREKPVLVVKAGRGKAARRAAMSHTASLAGDYTAYAAAFAQAGIIVAETGRQLLDMAKALDWQPLPAGPRVAIISNSGGMGVELSDCLESAGLEVPELSETTQERIRHVIPAFGSAKNPVDITTAWARFPQIYPDVIRILMEAPEVDVIVPVLLQRSAVMPEVAEAVRAAVALAREAGHSKPVYVCWVAPETARGNLNLLQSAGIPGFAWPGATATGVGAAWRYASYRNREKEATDERLVPPPAVDTGAPLEELLRAYGLPLVPSVSCTTATDAVAAAVQVGLPVVLKVLSPDIVHKSDAGGVRVGLASAGAVETAFAEIMNSARRYAPSAQLNGVQVQPMASGVEVVVGGYRDPQFGPMVMCGLGGIFVEVLKDVAFRLAPVNLAEARAMLMGLKGAPLLQGARGRPPVDVDKLAELVMQVSRLMAGQPVAELDLNPVMATDRGVTVVDWRLRLQANI